MALKSSCHVDQFLTFFDYSSSEGGEDHDEYKLSDTIQFFATTWNLDHLVQESRNRSVMRSTSDKLAQAGGALLGMVKDIAKMGIASASAAVSIPSSSGMDSSPMSGTATMNAVIAFAGPSPREKGSVEYGEAFPSGEGREESPSDASSDERSPAAAEEETLSARQIFEDLSESTLPVGLIKNHLKCKVSLLGVEVIPSPSSSSSSSSGNSSRLSQEGEGSLVYLFRIRLCDKRQTSRPTRQDNAPSCAPEDNPCGGEGLGQGQGQGRKRSAFAQFSAELCTRSQLRLKMESWSVFTIRRDLPSLICFHSEMVETLSSLSRLVVSARVSPLSESETECESSCAHRPFRDLSPPSFVDPFLIGEAEEAVKRNIRRIYKRCPSASILPSLHAYWKPPFLGAKQGHDDRDVVQETATTLDRSKTVDGCFEALEMYLDSLFSLMDEINDVLEDLSTDGLLDQAAAVAASPSSSSAKLKKAATTTTPIVELGKLLARFLRTSDTDDYASSSSSSPPPPPRRSPPAADKQGLVQDLGRPFWYTHVLASNRSSKTTRTAAWEEAGDALPVMCMGSRGGVVHICPFFSNEKGGPGGNSLSSKSESEQLRIQRSRCLGCGEMLYSGLGLGLGLLGALGLGNHKNFAPCRYYGGLFCKRWCHREDLRVIPYRLLLFWDGKPHRVCLQAASFLDTFSSSPVVDVPSLNPLLFEGVPMLRKCFRLRAQIALLIEAITHDKGSIASPSHRPNRPAVSLLREALLSTLGPTRAHLCTTGGLFSLLDLLEIQSGRVLTSMEQLLLALFSILDAHR